MPPPPDFRRCLGDFGERAAAAYLIRQGYTILDQQWRCRMGEIDLVASQEGQLVFVEVRTRRSETYGSPEESLTPAKRERLRTLAWAYLEAHAQGDTVSWRIDVIAIVVSRAGRVVRLHHIPSAVEQE
ncbi:MAG: YraN family protein [Chloroflexaceae bacterium]|nr:YraN family protein [Chloroflexaceae bacterium]